MTNPAFLAASLAPAWAVIPMAIVTLLAVAAHVRALAEEGVPASRRRIRSANALVMLLAIPIGAYAIGIAQPQTDQRRFVFAWTLLAALLLVITGLALLDMLNTYRLYRKSKRELLRRLAHAKDAAPAREMQ